MDAANSGGVIKQLMERKSVRAFEERPVPEEKKRMILQAAMEAPTAGNQQLYTILDITDQHIKERLAESCDHQPFIARAPMVLVFCADCLKWFDAYREAGCLAREPGGGRSDAGGDRYSDRGAECRDSGMEHGDRLLLYRRYYGAVQDPAEDTESAGICIPGSDGGLWISDRKAEGA